MVARQRDFIVTAVVGDGSEIYKRVVHAAGVADGALHSKAFVKEFLGARVVSLRRGDETDFHECVCETRLVSQAPVDRDALLSKRRSARQVVVAEGRRGQIRQARRDADVVAEPLSNGETLGVRGLGSFVLSAELQDDPIV